MALGLLLIRFNDLPASVPVFVSLLGTPTAWAPTSFVMVARIPLMGAGQLMAVTAMRYGSAATPAWRDFFQWMAAAIAAKTVLESVMLAGTGTRWGHAADGWLHALTILIVAAFIAFAVMSWHKGALRQVPALAGTPARLAVAAGIALWFAFATIPYWWS